MRYAEHEARYRRAPQGRGRGGRPPWAGNDAPPAADEAPGWFAGRLPEWFTGAPEVTIDRDEIVVVGTLSPPEVEGGDAATIAAAEAGRIKRFREETRDARIDIAREAEHRFGRNVAWGATAGATTELFTTASVPVMTRLRQPERQVLDTLVDAGVARSRSDALAWCVRLVGRNQEEWIASLRDALVAVERARSQGPESG
ncbi:MAG: hypothetical protein QOE45_829 [Frankiaceae bacterium]|jgi:hypothetical protein|nr:hypothetical protein [Frankiaceae bacterium]